MKNKTYIWISLAILGIGGFFIYKEFKKPKSLTKKESIKIITDNIKLSNKEIISTFEDGFLIEWARAILDKKPTFIYQTKEYNVQGGKAIKK
jgi:hypothetical protein